MKKILLNHLENKEYLKIKQILEDLELESHSNLSEFDPYYSCFLAGIYCILNHVSSCRFLIKRTRSNDADFNQWSKISSCLASYQFKKIHKLLEFEWNHDINHDLSLHFSKHLLNVEFQRLSAVYSSIEPTKASNILGIPLENIGNYVRENSWDIDAAAGTKIYMFIHRMAVTICKRSRCKNRVYIYTSDCRTCLVCIKIDYIVR